MSSIRPKHTALSRTALPIALLAVATAPAALAGDAYKDVLNEAYQAYKGLNAGKNADGIPALAKADPNLYGLAIVTVTGGVYEAGAARAEFPIESVGSALASAGIWVLFLPALRPLYAWYASDSASLYASPLRAPDASPLASA